MRTGILTLHDSPNYGAVLQAYALRAHLSSLGHEAFVIDRRRADAPLRTPPPVRDSVKLAGLFRADARNGAREYEVRCARTLAFLRGRVGMSPCHFSAWSDAPRDLGVDAVVVGSDQVWNANNLDPADYLLGGIPGSPPGIAYAASIGMPEFPADKLGEFRAGFARFAAIGVREREAVEMVQSLGFAAEHVVDPVLLAGREAWRSLLAEDASRVGGTPGTFAYFLAEDVEAMLPELADFAARTGRRIGLFVDWYVRRAPHGIGGWMKNGKFWRKWRNRGIDFRLDAGPEEFVRSIAAAEAVVSNSYHALMFSLVFGREVRIVLPTHPVRRQMNARLREFEGTLTDGPLIAAGLSGALASLAAGERVTVRADALSARTDASRAWLSNALEALGK